MLYDKDLREPLYQFLDYTYGKIRIIEEKTMGKSRADAVMIMEDSLCGIEIKSDADTYSRLSRQVKDYDKFYDYNYAAVGAKHALHISEHIPDYWGIIIMDLEEDKVDFYIERRPLPNPKCKAINKMHILWRDELSLILSRNRMPKYQGKSKKFICEKLIEKIPPEELSKQVSDALFERDYTKLS